VAKLNAMGLSRIVHLKPEEANQRYFQIRARGERIISGINDKSNSMTAMSRP
jgi:hypothetical protein